MQYEKFKKVKAPETGNPEIRGLGVMIETMNDNIMFLAENQLGIEEKLGRVERVQEEHTEKLDQLGVEMVIVQEDLLGVQKRLTGVETKVGRLESRVVGLEAKIA